MKEMCAAPSNETPLVQIKLKVRNYEFTCIEKKPQTKNKKPPTNQPKTPPKTMKNPKPPSPQTNKCENLSFL